MLKTKYLAFFLLLGICLVAKGQSLVITGHVYDAETKSYMPYANIASKSNSIGTATNSLGEFKLIIPDNNQQDSLIVSFIGFKSKTIAIPATSQTIEVILMKEQTQLDEVLLKGFTAETIVKKAIDQIPNNYFDKAYVSSGFYRVSSQKDAQYIHLSEAVFDVYHSKESKPYRQFKLHKKRSIKDEAASKGIDLGLRPTGVYGFDIVNNLDQMDFLNKKGLKEHSFKISGHVIVNGKEAYKVSFDQLKSSNSGYKGYLLIDKSSFAFLYFDFGLSPKGVHNHKFGDAGLRAMMKIMGIQITMDKNQYQIEYKKIGTKYYLNKVGNDASLHFKSDRNHYNYRADTRVDYIVNSTNFDNVKPFSNDETLNKGKLIEQQNSNLDPDFWRDYTIILPTHDFGEIAKKLQANNQANDLRIKAEDAISKLPKDKQLRIDSILQFYNDHEIFNGNALVLFDNKILLNKSYNNEFTKNQPDSQFRIGSLSKSFTSMVIMQLENEGKLRLQDSISNSLPDYKNGQITIAELLSHQSGIPDFLGSRDYSVEILSKSFSLGEVVNKFCSDSLNFKPGTKFEYSNSNFTILALIAEKIEKKAFEKILADRIFTPLQMSSSFLEPSGDTTRLVTAYLYGIPEPKYHPQNVTGAGGITSTTKDLLKWSEALDKKSLLPEAKMKELFEPRIAYTDWDAFYGYGWMIDDYKFSASKKHKIVYHPGTDLGFYTMFLKQPDTGITIILLNNTGEFPRFEISELMLNELN